MKETEVPQSALPTNPARITVPPGLDNVIVATTHISDVDGASGRLTYRGVAISDVVERYPTWTALVPWLVTGLPDAEPAAWTDGPPRQILGTADPMARLAMLVWAAGDGAVLDTPLESAAFVQSLPAQYARLVGRGAGKPEDPARAFLLAMTSHAPTPAEVSALNAYWVLAAEHSLNASTFAVRVAASTGARLPEALAAGIATLSGPLHGGAPTGVLSQLAALEQEADLEGALWRLLERGERLMGFGHRVYRTEDPRAARLRGVLHTLGGAGGAEHASRVEQAALAVLARWKPERPLAVNVEFYAALVLSALGLAAPDCPVTFACARLAGWTAHYWEQRATGRLIRPLARYTPSP